MVLPPARARDIAQRVADALLLLELGIKDQRRPVVSQVNRQVSCALTQRFTTRARLLQRMKPKKKLNHHLSRNYYNVREAADYLGKSERSIRRHYASGDLRHHRVGHSVRFSKSDLDDFAPAFGGIDSKDRQFISEFRSSRNSQAYEPIQKSRNQKIKP